MNYQMIGFVIGRILWTEAVLLLLPALAALLYGESAMPFLGPILLLLIAGLPFRKKPRQTSLYARDGFAVVALTYLCGTTDYNGAGMAVITAALEQGTASPSSDRTTPRVAQSGHSTYLVPLSSVGSSPAAKAVVTRLSRSRRMAAPLISRRFVFLIKLPSKFFCANKNHGTRSAAMTKPDGPPRGAGGPSG